MKTLSILYIIFISLSFSFLKQESPLEESMKRGQEIYTDFCVVCHLGAGEGVSGTFPPIAKSDYLINNRTETIKGMGITGKPMSKIRRVELLKLRA